MSETNKSPAQIESAKQLAQIHQGLLTQTETPTGPRLTNAELAARSAAKAIPLPAADQPDPAAAKAAPVKEK